MESVDPDAYRSVMGHLAAGVTVVTGELDGEDVVMTATAFASVSLDPPLALVSVAADSRMDLAVAETGTYAVSMLPASAKQTATRFALPQRPSDRLLLADLPWRRGATGLVVLDHAIAAVECELDRRVEAGDHALLIGRVVAVHEQNPGHQPLLHFRSRYHVLGE